METMFGDRFGSKAAKQQAEQALAAQNQAKQQVAKAAVAYIEPNQIIGVGTGSTVNCLIDEMAKLPFDVKGAVASSIETQRRLQAIGIEVFDLNEVGDIPLYIDGADEFNPHGALIKGGGGALTREKIIAEAAHKFICIVDETKQVPVLGQFPLPIEVIPMARSLVARKLVKLGANPSYRFGFTTDNGNVILDVADLNLAKAYEMERVLNDMVGVVTVGLFALRPADKVLMSKGGKVEIIDFD